MSYIQCAKCRASDFELLVLEKDSREIREGSVVCRSCQQQFQIHKGILNLMPSPSETIQSEQRGWVEMLGETSEELVETMLRLPHYEGDLWLTVSQNFDQALSLVDFENKRVLDIGAGRCWSTRWIANRGAKFSIAFDILLERFIGLETADIFFDDDEDLNFERIVGDMNDLPFRSEGFDIVFLTGTLHHSSDIDCVMAGISRVLCPGGLAVIINEPVRSLLRSKGLFGNEEIEHGINENIYTIFQYLSATRRAQLKPRLFFPRSVSHRLKTGAAEAAQEMGRVGHKVISSMWKTSPGRKLLDGPMLAAAYLISSMPLIMVARKS